MTNEAVIERGLSGFGRQVNLLSVMERIADDVMSMIASFDDVPVDTGNLKDSTGIGIYFGDTLLRYVSNPIAKVPRKNIGLSGFEKGEVWGKDVIQDALNAGKERYNLGYHLVLFSSMPYAGMVDKNQYFSSQLRRDLNTVINRITQQYGNIFHIEDTR